MQKSPVTIGQNEHETTDHEASKAQQGDSNATERESHSAKQNAKQNAKRAKGDTGLAKVIDAWPTLPDAIKAAVLAMVDASKADRSSE